MDQFAPNAGPFGDRPPMDCLKRHHVSLLDPQPIFDDVRTVGGTTGYARGSAGQIGTVLYDPAMARWCRQAGVGKNAEVCRQRVPGEA